MPPLIKRRFLSFKYIASSTSELVLSIFVSPAVYLVQLKPREPCETALIPVLYGFLKSVKPCSAAVETAWAVVLLVQNKFVINNCCII